MLFALDNDEFGCRFVDFQKHAEFDIVASPITTDF